MLGNTLQSGDAAMHENQMRCQLRIHTVHTVVNTLVCVIDYRVKRNSICITNASDFQVSLPKAVYFATAIGVYRLHSNFRSTTKLLRSNSVICPFWFNT